MLPVCRQRLATRLPLARMAFQPARRFVSSDNTKSPSDLPLESLFSDLGRGKDEPESKNAMESISSILQSSTEKQHQASASSSVPMMDVLSDGTYDINHITSSLTELSQSPYQLHINASFNNTIITLTRPNGSPLVATSGGSAGFKKAQRSGYEAAHQAAVQLLDKMNAKNLQIQNIHIILKGFGPGRDAAFKALTTGQTWSVRRITDATPTPFGGCRPKKARRL
ncbi:hypothetical protein BC940DRAFT_292782 [Gongronella butleri]|nr:hypothetical protein BC940DRAFT_292782 [Gongronella butleri]